MRSKPKYTLKKTLQSRTSGSMPLVAHTSLLPFDTEMDPGSAGPLGTKWVQKLENDTTAINITGHARLKALLLHIFMKVCMIFAADADDYYCLDISHQSKMFNAKCMSPENP